MGTREERHHCHQNLVPLAELISRELRHEKMEKPTVRYGSAGQSKKGEDYLLIKTDCLRIPGNPSSSFTVFAIFDGHNGNAAAIYSRDNLLNHVLGAIPRGLGRDEWIQALPRALVAGFVKTDKEFQRRGQTSGTTATFVIIDGWTVTVASVGDSRCILDTQAGTVSELTVDHRLEDNEDERQRVTASGGEVGRLSIFGGTEIGPLRCWPGGLCLSRSIGDMDVGEFIVPIPYVKQVKLSNVGGRLIVASDGIWDALSSEIAANSCRGLPAELAARQVVKEALRTRGLKDDTTCIVVDIIPPDNSTPEPLPPPKKHNKLQALFFRKRSRGSAVKLANRLSDIGIVEELYEEGSAMLAERLGNDDLNNHSTSGIFICAICQTDLAPNEGVSVHAGSIFSMSSKPWQGPFLCADCRNKKDAMEGKRPSGIKSSCISPRHMDISSHNSSFNYDGCDEPNRVKKLFNEIIAKAPKNSEWTAFTDLFQYQGFWYTARFLEGIILAQEQFIARPNDIILCSSPRTGTTWLKALAFAVMNRSSLDETSNPLLVTLPHECVPYLEVDIFQQKTTSYPKHPLLAVDIFQQKTTSYPKHPLLATHLPYSSLPKSVVSSNSKLVYICRDPKDVFVSLWHFIGNVNAKENEHFPLENAFDLFCRGISLNGPYWEHVLGYWRASLEFPERILFLKYEDLKTDTVSHVRKLAQFIGCPFSSEEEEDGHVQKIVELCSFKNLSNLEVNKTGEYPMFASFAVKNHRYFRKGEVGDWKNCMSEEMREHLDYITEVKLNGSGFTFQQAVTYG